MERESLNTDQIMQQAEMQAEAEHEAALTLGIDEGQLGPCGCTDYHMTDCNLVTGYTYDPFDEEEGFFQGGRW